MSMINQRFSFTSSALPEDTFELVSFNGSEGLSRLYRFDITLMAEDDGLDLEEIIQSRATLKILREDGDIIFHGILSTFEQMQTIGTNTHYRAVLSPLFWLKTLTHHNQIFLNKTIPQIIEAAIKDGSMTTLDYEFRLSDIYLPHEYVCQYNETHHSFISRLMEREGIYYYFEQGEKAEKLIITDTAMTHSVMEEGEKLFYSPPSGLDESSREEVIKTLVCCQKSLPAKILLKDYNYRKPSLELTAEHTVSEKGLGEVYIYGEHFQTPEDGKRLARIRAEALQCRARTFQGESLIPYLRPGYLFKLIGHNRKDFNTSYLTTDITHHGSQAFLFTAGLGKAPSQQEASPYYRNSFTAISSESQFRPERTTEKPRFAGTMNATIDAAGSGKYAEIDDQGRYKVRLPFDLNSPEGKGKASSWIRMAQPYAGETHGMHFPLHKGTEVLLTFIDGDPDRPIIASAVPNPLTPSPVTSANNTMNKIKSAGGNEIHLEDEETTKRILLNSPNKNTWVRMGAPNDPPGFYIPKLLYNKDETGNNSNTTGTLKITIEPEDVHKTAVCTVTSDKDTSFKPIEMKNEESCVLEPGNYTLTFNHVEGHYKFEPTTRKVTIKAGKESDVEAYYRKTKEARNIDDTNAKVEELEEKQKELEQEMADKEAEQEAEEKKEQAREGGLRLNTEGHLEFAATMENKMIRGEQLEIVLGNAYDVLVGTETSFKVAAALEMFLGMKMDMALATNIEYGFGLWHTHFNEGELSGNHKVEINAGGTSVTLDVLVAAMAALAAVDTAIVAGIGFGMHDLPDDDHKKEWFVNTNGAAYTALLAALNAAVFISQKLNPIQYNSRIELSTTGIEQNVLIGSIENTVGAGTIKNEVLTGNIHNEAPAGSIINSAAILSNEAHAGLTNTAPTITNTAEGGTITNTAAAIISTVEGGGITNTAQIMTNEATTSITNTAPSVIMATTGNAAKVQLATNACNVTANTGNFSFLSAVQIQAGTIIKLQ